MHEVIQTKVCSEVNDDNKINRIKTLLAERKELDERDVELDDEVCAVHGHTLCPCCHHPSVV